MRFDIQELLLNRVSGTTYYTAAIIACVILISMVKSSNSPNLSKIPTVGSSTWLGSWWAGIIFPFNATSVVQEGYDKYKGKPFKVSTPHRWMVIVSGSLYVEEFRKFRDDELNFMEATGEILEAEYTLGHDTHHNPYHIDILRSKITRQLTAIHAIAAEEVIMASDEILDLKDEEWKSIPASSTVQNIIARAVNRVLVGLPLCRDRDWVKLNIDFTLDVVKGAVTIGLFPRFMAPLVARFMTNVPASIRRGAKHLASLIKVRQQLGDDQETPSPDYPNDFLQWLIDGSENSRRNINDITPRVLALNFAAIYITSNVGWKYLTNKIYRLPGYNHRQGFTQTLYNLAVYPQYVQELRDEAESVVKEEGWSKASVKKMHKIDSFLKETQRMHGIGLLNMGRKTMKDVTFTDGTVLPKGTYVAMASQAMHLDDDVYDNAKVFNPWRFSNARAGKGIHGTKYQFPVTSPDYLVFGHGRHSCPGRFFAASLLNTMLAHFVITYDVKLEGDNTTRPKNLHIGTSVAANPTARVMIRKRATRAFC